VRKEKELIEKELELQKERKEFEDEKMDNVKLEHVKEKEEIQREREEFEEDQEEEKIKEEKEELEKEKEEWKEKEKEEERELEEEEPSPEEKHEAPKPEEKKAKEEVNIYAAKEVPKPEVCHCDCGKDVEEPPPVPNKKCTCCQPKVVVMSLEMPMTCETFTPEKRDMFQCAIGRVTLWRFLRMLPVCVFVVCQCLGVNDKLEVDSKHSFCCYYAGCWSAGKPM